MLHNSSEGLFIHLPQCSSWLFLRFFRRLGCLMIPACLSSVYLTPSSALCGLPPVLAGAQSCTDHFILWDKPVFQSPLKPWGSSAGAPRLEPQRLEHCHGLHMWQPVRCFYVDLSFWLIKSQAEVHIPALVIPLT